MAILLSFCRFVLILLLFGKYSQCWKHSALIYHWDGRNTTLQWQRHIMRIDPLTGNFNALTAEWLFDAAILTADKVNNVDIMYGDNLAGSDCVKLLDEYLIRDAHSLDDAITPLTQIKPLPSLIPIFIAFPYINNKNQNFIVPNDRPYDLTIPSERYSVLQWYLNLVKNRHDNEYFTNIYIAGVYYHREDVVDAYNDLNFTRQFNDYAHAWNFKTVWIPYYDAPNAWDGKSLGFDTVIIQPRYSFLSSMDGGILKGDRLYSAGFKANGSGLGMEYELRSSGYAKIENWVAHQYLAISQVTGVSNNPQAFFVGIYPDLFDNVVSQTQALADLGDGWWAYSDLANYLRGDTINNYEVGIPTPTTEIAPVGHFNIKQSNWTNVYPNLNSIRIDFNDFQENIFWRGRVVVVVNGQTAHSSYAQRAGVETINPYYSSVFVPLSNENILVGAQLTIQIIKETDSPWPYVMRTVACLYEPKFISSAVFLETSYPYYPVSTTDYLDSFHTYEGYQYNTNGKLTDGVTVSNGSWAQSVGWNQIEKRFSITIDLGSVVPISSVIIYTSSYPLQAVRLPDRLVAYVADNCEPQERGTTLSNGCPPNYATGAPVTTNLTTNWGRTDSSIALSFTSGASGRFVTVSGVSMSWTLIHEVSVLNGASVISNNKPYRVTPAYGSYNKDIPFRNNFQLLTDGAVFSEWTFANQNSIGINAEQTTNGQVEIHFKVPRINYSYAAIWVTTSSRYGIEKPSSIIMEWLNQNNVWVNEGAKSVDECGPSPCAKLSLQANVQVFGIRGTFPTPPLDPKAQFMVTEISLMN